MNWNAAPFYASVSFDVLREHELVRANETDLFSAASAAQECAQAKPNHGHHIPFSRRSGMLARCFQRAGRVT
ncbi:hypothetical protein SBA5_1190012 [Candidatus Sulfotelmatomonas gaucii]|uniref:Uncharacterized protein n=1 Tax=Candidatus Sulfuritelmatomonas gaucii TaxID=2043161 RepID=A0A2N9L3W7_9BACT|nr:hypothetical protein SBA5_1190012 [Candidatus Sulfotelmatomonas gaucii]